MHLLPKLVRVREGCTIVVGGLGLRRLEGSPLAVGRVELRVPSREYQVVLTVLGGGVVGLAAVALDHFRTGCLLLGLSVLFAALARLLLPARRVGLLVVRSRAFDVVVLAGMGVALVVLAIIVPPQR